ncbi:hypothetical protein PVAP13_9KG045057 [Panicum virgatum]|uniref:Uncharacterized protein n=1 Tax=Panicum virgatum TaxID=38727 RepID=A0A8T0NBI7_PANVG|nr:hypothetical protein PVAP13_9KG045057 [Panicum virgatum]
MQLADQANILPHAKTLVITPSKHTTELSAFFTTSRVPLSDAGGSHVRQGWLV